MRLVAPVLLLLLPGALAAHLHRRLKGQPASLKQLAVFAVYTLILDAVLCGFKLLRGAALANFWDWFSPPLSFSFYLAAACFMALALPVLYILITERRFALRLMPDTQAAGGQPIVKWNARRFLRVLLKMGAVLLAGILIGAILVTAAYTLPPKNIVQNVRKSAETVKDEGSYPFLYQNWRSTRLDNFTDSIMLLLAAYEGDQGVIKNAMLSTYTRFADHDPAQGLVKWATGDVSGIQTHSYSRYWHGYLVWLKPLLEVFEYRQIRVINTVLQILLVLAALFVMLKKGWKRLTIPFLVMVLFLTPVALFKSFQFSWIYYVFMVSVLVLMLRFEKFKGNRSFYLLFLLTGMATSFVDFLTYPLITLGVPLTIYLVLREHRTLRRCVLDVAALSLAWGAGYVGMWAGKWALCSLLTDSNIFLSVGDNISSRMTFNYLEVTFTWKDVIQWNIEAYNHWIYMGPFWLCLAGYAVFFGRERIAILDRRLSVSAPWLAGVLAPLLLAALIPFAWFFVASNHTYIHYWYAHRTLAVSALAALSLFARRPPR
ncbi:MAG: hypothetical protein ABIK64_00555 [Bacillota bacterium]